MCLSNMGVLSHKLSNTTHWGGSYRLLPTLFTSAYVCFTNTFISSLAAGWTINAWWDIFLQVTTPSLLGRVEVTYDICLHFLIGLLFVLVIYNFCGAATLRLSNFKEVLVTPLSKTLCLYLCLDFSNGLRSFFYGTRNRISNGLVICRTLSFGTKKPFK